MHPLRSPCCIMSHGIELKKGVWTEFRCCRCRTPVTEWRFDQWEDVGCNPDRRPYAYRWTEHSRTSLWVIHCTTCYIPAAVQPWTMGCHECGRYCDGRYNTSLLNVAKVFGLPRECCSEKCLIDYASTKLGGSKVYIAQPIVQPVHNYAN